MARLNINGKDHDVDVDPNTPLLWVIRENVGLTGTKYGCGIAQCGACTVHIDGVAMRSCSLPVSAAVGKKITTIEGLAQNGVLHKVQKAWIDHDVPQCGYCQSRHDHGGGGAAQEEAEADRRRHRPRRSPTSAAAAPSSRCARRSTPRRTREGRTAMNYVPKMNRRSFVVGTAAAGGGLAHRLRSSVRPEGRQRRRRATPEVGAWVVIKPDDTVVIRIARSEMGQGTLTGLAQLVAEELECDWSKVTSEYPTPGQNVARKRVWGHFSTGGSRGIRKSHEYVRQGGAAARMMLMQAAANEWKVPVARVHGRQQRHHAQAVRPHAPRYGKVADAAAKLPVPEKPTLKDPKDWKIAGKPLKRLDTADKVTGKQVYGIDLKLPGMLNAAIKECPVFGGKVKSFDAAKVAGMKGVKKVVQVGDTAVAVVADTWWQAKTALDALPIVWDEGPNAKVSSASIAEVAQGRARRRAGLRRQPERRRQGRHRRRGQEGRGGLLLSVPEPRSAWSR